MKRKIDIKDWVERIAKYGIERPESFAVLEESVTYGTNCFDLVFSENPYVGLRLFYDSINEKIIPVVIRVMVKKKDCKIDKNVLEKILPSVLAAEEDEDVMLLALRVPKFEDLDELIQNMIEIAKNLKEVCGMKEGARLEGYVPTDCTRFIHVMG